MSIDFSDDGFAAEEPLVSTSLLREDDSESSRGPSTLAEYIGQKKAKGNLEVFIQAAKLRGEALGSCAAPWPARFGQDHALRYYCQ